jgi:adenine phosphoribosyltransferase
MRLAADVLERFRWVEGHADVWPLFADGELLRSLAAALAAPFTAARPTKVAGVESRGFLLGAAVAAHLGVGFVAIRKGEGLLPGAKVSRVAAPDYRGREHLLRLQRDVLTPADRVILVDDWVEVGSQATTARELLEEVGATYVGCSVIVDDTTDAVRARLEPFAALVERAALGPDTEG